MPLELLLDWDLKLKNYLKTRRKKLKKDSNLPMKNCQMRIKRKWKKLLLPSSKKLLRKTARKKQVYPRNMLDFGEGLTMAKLMINKKKDLNLLKVRWIINRWMLLRILLMVWKLDYKRMKKENWRRLSINNLIRIFQ